MRNNYIAHHGITGQKWGHKNGPPYPLNFSKLSPEEKAAAKRETIKRGDVTTAKFNKDLYTNEEIKALIDRNRALSMLDAESSREYKIGKHYVNEISSNINTIANIGKNTSSIYNLIATINNVSGGNMKILKVDKDKKKE